MSFRIQSETIILAFVYVYVCVCVPQQICLNN